MATQNSNVSPIFHENKVVGPLWARAGQALSSGWGERCATQHHRRDPNLTRRWSGALSADPTLTHPRDARRALQAPGARPRAPSPPTRAQTFSPLDVVPAIQDLLQQSHQGEGADEDEEQSSVPQQIPARRGVRVAHPGGCSRAAGRGLPGVLAITRGAPGPRGTHYRLGGQAGGDLGQSFRPVQPA